MQTAADPDTELSTQLEAAMAADDAAASGSRLASGHPGAGGTLPAADAPPLVARPAVDDGVEAAVLRAQMRLEAAAAKPNTQDKVCLPIHLLCPRLESDIEGLCCRCADAATLATQAAAPDMNISKLKPVALRVCPVDRDCRSSGSRSQALVSAECSHARCV